LLKQGADINGRFHDGMTALHCGKTALDSVDSSFPGYRGDSLKGWRDAVTGLLLEHGASSGMQSEDD